MNHKVLHIDADDGDYGYSLSFHSQDKMIQIHRYNKGIDFLALDGALHNLSLPALCPVRLFGQATHHDTLGTEGKCRPQQDAADLRRLRTGTRGINPKRLPDPRRDSSERQGLFDRQLSFLGIPGAQ